MTKGVIGSVLLGVWLGCFTAASAQLPPQILLDRYLITLERFIVEKDPVSARETLEKIGYLEEVNDLITPEDFTLTVAQVEMLIGSLNVARERINKHLMRVGREGKYYQRALELLDQVEQLYALRKDYPTCAGQFSGAECWQEVTGQPGCYVWNHDLTRSETMTWTGKCSGGRAQGEGTLKRIHSDETLFSESTGRLQDGKRDGKWVVRWAIIDTVGEGPYVGGKKHGHWVKRSASGHVEEGSYAEDKKHGHWVEIWANGSVHEGPYVEGLKQGKWSWRSSTGRIDEGSFWRDQKDGRWFTRTALGGSSLGHFRNGRHDGRFVSRNQDGSVDEGFYVDNEKHGQWVVRWPDGSVEVQTYEQGKQVKTERFKLQYDL